MKNSDIKKNICRACALCLAAVMPLSAYGCTAMLSNEYVSVTDHVDQYWSEEDDSDILTVSNYYGLINAISKLVSECAESGVIRLYNFGEDVGTALSEACIEVQRQTALGAYAVDYFVTSGYSRIVSYYEAEIYINYRRTEEQIESITRVSSASDTRDAIKNALEEQSGYLVFETSLSSLTPDVLFAAFSLLCAENAFLSLSMPSLRVTQYPEDGVQRILELEFTYTYTLEERSRMSAELYEGASSIITSAEVRQSDNPALAVCELLGSTAAYDQQAVQERAANPEGPRSSSFGAWGAVCGGLATGEGFALAYRLLCQSMGLSCETVNGTLGGLPHSWNTVSVDGRDVIVDASQLARGGEIYYDISEDALIQLGYASGEISGS